MLKPWFDHEAVNHSVSEFVRGQAHTNGMDSFRAMLKRGHQGIHHKFSPKHPDRYVTEFAGRHNAREADTVDQMAGIRPALARDAFPIGSPRPEEFATAFKVWSTTIWSG